MTTALLVCVAIVRRRHDTRTHRGLGENPLHCWVYPPARLAPCSYFSFLSVFKEKDMTDYSRFLRQTEEDDARQSPPAIPGKDASLSLLPRPEEGEKFIAMNMPWSWFATAAHLPGKALAIGLILWWLVAVRKRAVVVFSYKRAQSTGLSDESIRQCIRRLERAGLIEVKRAPGRSPRVRVLPAPRSASRDEVDDD